MQLYLCEFHKVQRLHFACDVDKFRNSETLMSNLFNISVPRDIVLISPTVHSLQIMLDVCASFAQEVDMKFNSSKSVVMRVGTRFKLPCLR